MPPKKARDEMRKKQEIAAKVREIKERQQKWMNEKKEFDEGKPCNSTPARPSDNNRKSGNTSSQHKLLHTSPPGHSDILEQISPERNHVEKWLQHNSTPVNPSTVSSYKPSNYETPPLSSSDDFNEVADRIIHRVKDKLGVSTDQSYGAPKHSDYTNDSVNTYPSQKPLPAHLCPKCQKLMVTPRHSPMMLIPCGHNLCEACCRGAVTCYSCDTGIGSSTSNIMLQQIIQSKTSTNSHRVSNTLQTNHRASQQKDAENEIQTLLLRKDAMDEEKSNIRHKISQINRSIEREADQITSIEQKENSIIKEIAQLQNKLGLLHQHKEEFRGKITSYQGDITTENKKLAMINETTQYLDEQLEKLRRKTGTHK